MNSKKKITVPNNLGRLHIDASERMLLVFSLIEAAAQVAVSAAAADSFGLTVEGLRGAEMPTDRWLS